MDDIFDEADEILSEAALGEDEKNFNESELQDIMSEIEDLEKEFEAETKKEMTLQEKIDAELEMEIEEARLESTPESKPEHKVVPVAEALAFEKPVHVAVTPVSSVHPKPEVSFAAHGQMTLNLDFQVGHESAKLYIDPVKGLVVTLSGVELCINEDTGCTVSMENGMKFTIPLSSQVNSHKKNVA